SGEKQLDTAPNKNASTHRAGQTVTVSAHRSSNTRSYRYIPRNPYRYKHKQACQHRAHSPIGGISQPPRNARQRQEELAPRNPASPVSGPRRPGNQPLGSSGGSVAGSRM